MAAPQITANSSGQEFDAIRFAGAVAKAAKKSSLTRNAKDSIALFPSIMSADIPTDDAMPIAKNMELHYASLLVSVISANSNFDMGTYANGLDYIKANFHNNSSIPAILRAGIESQLPEGFQPEAITAAMVSPEASKQVGPDFVLECWLGSDLMFDHATLNSKYTPAADTQAVMESIVEDLRKLHTPAMEAIDSLGNSNLLLRAARSGDPSRAGVGMTERVVNQQTTRMYQTEKVTTSRKMATDKNGNPIFDANGNRVYTEDTTTTTEEKPFNEITGRTTVSSTGKQGLVPNQKLNGMEPTMINLQLTGKDGCNVVVQNIVMGVKVCIQQVSSDVMVANLVQGVSGSRAMFAFIKWTQGQLGFIKDFIFGVASAKEAAISNRDMKNWICALKRRKKANLMSRLGTGESIPPTTTIIITSHEAARVAAQTGVDLNEPYAAIKLMDAYYFLGVMIVDTTTGNLKYLYDGDTAYSSTSINALRGKTGKNDTDLSQYVAILRAAGGLK